MQKKICIEIFILILIGREWFNGISIYFIYSKFFSSTRFLIETSENECFVLFHVVRYTPCTSTLLAFYF